MTRFAQNRSGVWCKIVSNTRHTTEYQWDGSRWKYNFVWSTWWTSKDCDEFFSKGGYTPRTYDDFKEYCAWNSIK